MIREWMAPAAVVEQFMPNDYVASSCENPVVTHYSLTCNVSQVSSPGLGTGKELDGDPSSWSRQDGRVGDNGTFYGTTCTRTHLIPIESVSGESGYYWIIPLGSSADPDDAKPGFFLHLDDLPTDLEGHENEKFGIFMDLSSITKVYGTGVPTISSKS